MRHPCPDNVFPLCLSVGIVVGSVLYSDMNAGAQTPGAAQEGTSPAEPSRQVDPSVELRELSVSADELRQRRAAEDRVPLGRSAWERIRGRMHAARSLPAGVAIERAEYRARVDGDRLVDGELEINVRLLGDTPSVLLLNGMNLDGVTFHWADTKAVWGTLPSGSVGLLVDRSGTVKGTWSRPLKRIGDHLETDFVVPAAPVTTIRLQTADNIELTCTAGTVMSPDRAGDGAVYNKVVELGSQSRTRIRLRPRPVSAGVKPVVGVRRRVAWATSGESVRLECEFELNTLQGVIDSLAIRVPSGFRVESVKYGNDMPLRWAATDTRTGQELSIRLPEPLSGQARPIRIDGKSGPRSGAARELASPVVAGCVDTLAGVDAETVFLGGLARMRVESPLVLQHLQLKGMRQVDTIFDGPETQTLQFVETAADSAMQLSVGLHAPQLDAAVVSSLRLSSAEWLLYSRIVWSTESGKAFSTSFELPPEWELTDIRSFPPGESVNAGIEVAGDGGKRVTVQFAEAVSSENQQAIGISARRTVLGRSESLPLPVLRCPDAVSTVDLLALTHDRNDQVQLGDGSLYEAISPQNVPESLETLADGLVNTADESGTRLLISSGQEIQGQLRYQSARGTATVRARIEHVVVADLARETIRVEVEGRAERKREMHVYLSTSPPSLEWTCNGLAVLSRRLPVSQHRKMGLPPRGSLWSVGIPEGAESNRRYETVRTSSVGIEGAVTLAFAPSAGAFVGNVLVKTDRELAATFSDGTGNPAGNASRTIPARTPDAEVFQYSAVAQTLVLAQSAVDGTRRPVSAAVTLDTELRPAAEGFDLHTVAVAMNHAEQHHPLRIRIPAPGIVDSITRNGTRLLPPRSEDHEFLVTLDTNRDHNQVRVAFRTPIESTGLGERRRIVMPELSCNVSSFDWTLNRDTAIRLDAPLWGDHVIPDEAPVITSSSRRRGIADSPEIAGGHDLYLNSVAEKSTSDRIVIQTTGIIIPPGGTYRTVGRDRLAMIRILAMVAAAAVVFTCVVFGFVASSRLLLVAVFGILIAGFFPESVMIALIRSFLAAWLASSVVAVAVRNRRQGEPHPMSASAGGGSTVALRAAGNALLIVAAVTLSPSILSAQDGGPAADSTGRPIDVLVPESIDRSPAPFVYVRRSDLDQLLTMVDPVADTGYVITDSRYSISVTADNVAEVTGRFAVAVPETDVVTRVRLPLERMNPERCTVAGRDVPILVERGRYYVELPAADGRPETVQRPLAQEPLIGTDTPTVADGATAGKLAISPMRYFDLRVDLHPPLKITPGGGVLEIATPAVHRNSFDLQLPQRPMRFLVNGVVRDMNPPGHNDPNRIRFETVGASTVRMDWSRLEANDADASEVTADVAILYELSPSFLQVYCHVIYHSTGPALQIVEWDTPATWMVASAGAQRGVHTYSESVSSDRSRHFFEPAVVAGGTPGVRQVECSFIVSAPTDGAASALPVENLVASDRRVTLTSFAHACVAAPGFALNRVDSGDDSEPVVSAADLLKRFEGRPNVAGQSESIRLGDVGTSRFILRPAVTTRSVRTRHRIEARSDSSLDWTAELQIETGNGAVFHHELQIDPTLQIRSVKLESGGADRLAHSHRSGDRLTLFLNGRATEYQNLTIRGSIRPQDDGEIQIPNLRLKDADETETLLTVNSGSGSVIRVSNEPESSPVSTGAPLENRPAVSTYRLDDGRAAPVLHLVPRRRPQVSRVNLIDAGSATPTIVTAIHVTNTNFMVDSLEFRIPDVDAEQCTIESAAADCTLQTAGDSTLVSVTPHSENAGQAVVFTVKTPCQPGAAAELTLPDLEWISPVDADDLQYVSATSGVNVDSLNSASHRVPSAALPQWARDVLSDLAKWESESCLAGAGPWQIRLPDRGAPPTTEASVRLVEHAILVGSDSSLFGTSDFYVTGPAESVFSLNLPASLTTRSVSVNGLHSDAFVQEGSRLSVPIGQTGRTGIITVAWSCPQTRVPMFFGSVSLLVPESDSTPDAVLLRLQPDTDAIVRGSGQWHSRSAAVYALERVERMLEMIQTDDPGANPVLLHAIFDQSARIGESPGIESVMSETESNRELVERRSSLEATLLRLRSAIADDTWLENPSADILSPVELNGETFVLAQVGTDQSGTGAGLAFWMVNRLRLRNGLLILLMLAGAVVVKRATSWTIWGAAPWLPYLPAMIFGAALILHGAHSAIGLIIVLGATTAILCSARPALPEGGAT